MNVLNGIAPLRWLVREPGISAVDNGWRFFSAIDDERYLSDATNLTVVSFNTVANIEPAIIPILRLPVGSDLELVRGEDGLQFRDNLTGLPVSLD
ncbi:immunity protein Imm33 domain-containing protein [Microbacterium sp. 22242]|uniref:immunity protein Imm33 domain-containing protein n=1 Tax=Microbacterium sp. 22242 TaxID=3453896 RepID=UPI003F86FE61